MGTNQTTATTATILGSVMVQSTSDNFSTFVDLGLGDGFSFTGNDTPLDANPDNGTTPTSLAGIASQTVTFTGNLWEYNLTNINTLRGGVSVLANVSSALVAGDDQLVAIGDWAWNSMILLTGQNSDLTSPTINTVTGSTDGLLSADDWDTVYNTTEKKWYLIPRDGTTATTENQTLTINTDYTPVASQKLSTGGLSIASRVGLRLTNKVPGTATAAEAAANAGISTSDAIYRVKVWDIYYATVDGGEALSFKSKDDTNPVVGYTLNMLGKNKPDRTAGDQLYSCNSYIELQ